MVLDREQALKCELPDGRVVYQVEIKGEKRFVEFGNQWEGLTEYKKGGLTRRQKRAFMRLNSGLTNGVTKRERLVFLTLTTKFDKLNRVKDQAIYLKSINYGWVKLKQAIEKKLKWEMYLRKCRKLGRTPYKVHGKTKVILERGIYQSIKFKMRYFKVKTSEGGGVLHIIFRKEYHVPRIPYEWLSKQWQRIWHNSWNVSISQIKYSDAVKTAFYCIRGYIQNQPVVRMSYGYQWVYQGFRKSFVHLIEVYGYKRALEIWKKNMANDLLPTKAGTWQRRFKHLKIFGGKKYPQTCFDKDSGRLLHLPRGTINLSKPLPYHTQEQAQYLILKGQLHLKHDVGRGYALSKPF